MVLSDGNHVKETTGSTTGGVNHRCGVVDVPTNAEVTLGVFLKNVLVVGTKRRADDKPPAVSKANIIGATLNSI